MINNQLDLPAEGVDAVRVVFERCEFAPQHLQSFQDFPVLKELQILLLQEQELHPLRRGRERADGEIERQRDGKKDK